MLLHEIAHARAGDKGEITNICVFPYRDEDYPLLVELLTAERVAAHFAGIVTGEVLRYEVPTVCGLNFVLHGTRPGGVSAALELDAHGKSLSYGLLLIDLDLRKG
ncbi:AtuA-related protein [Actinophytocola sp.]|uniref:AtuA-related protein n=1 Tax=Actinophytocola sp. TaxID=1872138 RepID=UPI003D6BD0CB